MRCNWLPCGSCSRSLLLAWALTIPASIAIAQELGRSVGGTASALQGGLSFAIGAAATPLTGLTGQTSVAGMSLLMACLFVCSAAVLLAARAPAWGRLARAADRRLLLMTSARGPARLWVRRSVG